jgi:DNA-binding transcriptional regulator YdaS (Cro superfamily)
LKGLENLTVWRDRLALEKVPRRAILPCKEPKMTKLLDQALEAVRRLPSETQDEIARAMLTLAGDEHVAEEIDPTHLPDVLESLAQAKRRQFATDAEIETAFRRFDP